MRILVVEDDEGLGSAMKQSLTHAGYAADLVNNVSSTLQALSSEHFDAIVLDLGLPDRDGYEVVRYLRSQNKLLPVLILTARDMIEDRVQALDLGADDYVVKPIAMEELHARLRALIRRSAGRAGMRFSVGSLELDTTGKRAFLKGQPLDLSAREWTILEHLATHAGQIVSKQQLVGAIASDSEELSLNAIEVHIHRLREKMGKTESAIRTIRGLGYIFEE
jgi:two-component system OmpR family response regulator